MPDPDRTRPLRPTARPLPAGAAVLPAAGRHSAGPPSTAGSTPAGATASDRDRWAVPAARTPLRVCKPTDIWTPAPLGVDAHGRGVGVDLLSASVLVDAPPGRGATRVLRSLALHAALDPYVRMAVFDGAGTPYWRRFAAVADRCAVGVAPTADGHPVDLLLATLRELRDDVHDRYARLAGLPAELCPDGQLTRAIARDPAHGMPVRILVLDAGHHYLSTDPPATEIADLLIHLVGAGPPVGVTVVDATPRPAGPAGDPAGLVTAFRDHHQTRVVPHAGSRAERQDPALLRPRHTSVAVVRSAADATPAVRPYLADAADTDKILTVGRALRAHLGTLTGQATTDRTPSRHRGHGRGDLSTRRPPVTRTGPGAGTGHTAAPDPAVGTPPPPAGVPDGRPLALDLARTRGLGLIGPGVAAAVRALLLALLTEQHRPVGPGADILIPAADAHALLGERAAARPPRRLHVAADLDRVLDRVDTEILTRARLARTDPRARSNMPPLVVVATPTPAAERRLRAVLDIGTGLSLVGLLHGRWRPGATARV